MSLDNWSGRQDSNLRPPHPQCDALPGCATSRPPAGALRLLEARLYGGALLKARAVWLKGKGGLGALTLLHGGAGDNRPRLFHGAAKDAALSYNSRGDYRMNSVMILAAAGGASGSAFFVQIFPLLLIFVVFYLFLIRPQQKRAKEHEAKIAAVQKNDDVITGGGLMGKVTKVADDHVEVEIAPNVRVKAVKATLTNVQSRGTKAAND
jgi:preprotein translocase subunit YajC